MPRIAGQATRPKRVRLEVWDSCVDGRTIAKVIHAGEAMETTLKFNEAEEVLSGQGTFHDGSFVRVSVRLLDDARIWGAVKAHAMTSVHWDFNVQLLHGGGARWLRF